MQVQFTVIPQDAIMFWLYCDRHVPQFKRAFFKQRFIRPVEVLCAGIVGLLIAQFLISKAEAGLASALRAQPLFVGVFDAQPDSSALGLVILQVVGVALYMALYPQWRSYSLQRTVEQEALAHPQYMAEPIAYTITDDGFHIHHAYIDGTLLWKAIHQVVVTDDYIYVFYQADNAHVIPNRAFSSAEHRQTFIAELQRRSQEAPATA